MVGRARVVGELRSEIEKRMPLLKDHRQWHSLRGAWAWQAMRVERYDLPSHVNDGI